MDIKKILQSFGIEEDKIEQLKDSITREIGTDFIPKTQYQKKVLSLNELQEKYNDLEAKLNNANENEYKEKYEQTLNEFEQFKSNIENEKTLNTKTDLLKQKLQDEKFNKDIINLLVKEFDLSKIEVEENNIKDWDNVISPFKDKYSGFIQQEVVKGTNPANPPKTEKSEIDPFLKGFNLK